METVAERIVAVRERVQAARVLLGALDGEPRVVAELVQLDRAGDALMEVARALLRAEDMLARLRGVLV